MRSAVAILAAALLAAGIARNAWPWMVDDAFISLRFAERLVDGHGLTWTDGERVEGYSNLLWVLLTALCGWLGCDWLTAVRALGVACTLGTFAVLLASDLVPARLPARLAVAILAALGTTSVWAIGGLEAPLMSLLLAAAMANLHAALAGRGDRRDAGPGPAAIRRPLLGAGTALALACWTRPDAPLWAAFAAGAVLVFGRGSAADRLRRLAWLLLPVAAAVLLQLGFRLVYYGDWLPNTGRAKVSPSAASRRAGLDYVAAAALGMRMLLLPAALGVLALPLRRARPIVAFALVGTLAWWAYVWNVGGDAFPQSRLLVPTLAPLTVLAAHGLDRIASLGRAGSWSAGALAVLAIVGARVDAEAPPDPRHRLSDWEWSGLAAGEWLGRAFAERQPLLAVDAAGAVPFASRLPCLDMLGLCDRTIAATPVDPAGGFVAGHARANGAYVLSRRPDLVMFGIPPGAPQPQWLGGRQLEADPAFLRDYRVVLFHTGPTELADGRRIDLRLTLWTRVGGRVGVRRDPDGVRVPGYLLGSYRQPFSFFTLPDDPAAVARRAAAMEAGAQWWLAAAVVGVLAADGDVVGEVRRGGELMLAELPLAPGEYRLAADGPRHGLPDGVRLSLRSAGATVTPNGDAWIVAAADGAIATVDLVCDVPAGAALPFAIDHVSILRLR